MPFDRDATLRNAEKLLRQGKLDLAIAEYRSVVEADPADWNTANTLGDLYVRAKQSDKAVAQFGRIADHLANEGFMPKAVAVYRKILKIDPDDERAMWHLGSIAARQGLLVDARAQFSALAERRKVRGDSRGEAEARVRLGELEGADLKTRLAGARARMELGQTEQAVIQFKQLAADLREENKADQSLEMLTEALALAPDDAEIKSSLTAAYVGRGDFDAARQYATTPAELKGLADELRKQGREDEALVLLAAVAEADPSDAALRVELVKSHLSRGDKQAARALLTPDLAAADPELLWSLAEMELRDGRIAEGTALVQQILTTNPGKVDALVILGCSLGETNPDAGYECIELAARAAIASDEWGAAAAALNEFVHRVPHHIPALMRLVEICVDGGLEATMFSAQAQLADAYLEIGAGAEARVIAEDLVAREPWERTNIERFRRALILLGESDIDGMIAERLSGQSPFLSTDFVWPADTPAEEPARGEAVLPATAEASAVADAAPEGAQPQRSGSTLHAIDLTGIIEEHDSEAAGDEDQEHQAHQGPQEVDLSNVLNMRGDAAGGSVPGATIEEALKNVREAALPDQTTPEAAEEQFKVATSYIEMSMVDEAIKALETASRSLRHRFRAGAMLAKLYGDKGDKARAIEWFERAAEAPAPSPAAAHQLTYELAGALEAQGESARALALFLELQSDAGEYRDVAARLEQLMGSGKVK